MARCIGRYTSASCHDWLCSVSDGGCVFVIVYWKRSGDIELLCSLVGIVIEIKKTLNTLYKMELAGSPFLGPQRDGGL
jgi:hypothetical protein